MFRALAGGPLRAFGCIAQLVEQLTLNQRVVGSNPTAPTKNSFKVNEMVGGNDRLEPRKSYGFHMGSNTQSVDA